MLAREHFRLGQPSAVLMQGRGMRVAMLDDFGEVVLPQANLSAVARHDEIIVFNDTLLIPLRSRSSKH
jgi:hypothetical protein